MIMQRLNTFFFGEIPQIPGQWCPAIRKNQHSSAVLLRIYLGTVPTFPVDIVSSIICQ